MVLKSTDLFLLVKTPSLVVQCLSLHQAEKGNMGVLWKGGESASQTSQPPQLPLLFLYLQPHFTVTGLHVCSVVLMALNSCKNTSGTHISSWNHCRFLFLFENNWIALHMSKHSNL